MRNPNFKRNITLGASLIIVVVIILLNIQISMRFSEFSRYLVAEKLESNINSLNQRLEESRTNSRSAAVSMSLRSDVIDAIRERDTDEILRIFTETYDLYNVNYYTVTDGEGIVLARTHEPGIYGDSVTNQQNISDALSGKISTYTEPGTVVKISVRTGAPVVDEDGTIIGVISAGVRFDTNETVDKLKSVLTAEITAFYGDTRVATTLVSDGERITGTTLDPEIAEIVLGKGEAFSGEITLYNQTMETYYQPLIGPDGEPFAILVLGINIGDLISESTVLSVEVIVIGVLGIAITLILVSALRNMMNADKAKNSFFSTMSHEIRTPMNAILGITEVQLMDNKLSPDTRTALEKIYTSGDMLLSIINDILDLSKIEAGKLEVVIDEYETASLISDTAQLNMMRIGSKPIEFEIDIDENLPVRVRGDEIRLKQIINNLLSNAFKYTSEGKVTMSVSTKENTLYGSYEGQIVDEENIILVFVISDTGQGMTKQQISKLFDEYSRFNMQANRKTEGTGLGMSITRNLIKLMGGEIFVESTPGQGSVFTVHIPQERVDDEVLGSEMVENLYKFRAGSRSLMKRMQISREPMPYGSVMVVDDVETNIYVAKGLLAPYKLKVDSALSGYAVIKKVESGNVYDIIFMDHMMPEMDGIETTGKIREMGYTAPIVALTANAIAGQADMFMENGFDDYISKPIDIRQLNAVLNKLVRDKYPEEAGKYAAEMADAAKSIHSTSPVEVDAHIAEIFIRDARKSVPILETMAERKGKYSDDDMRLYTIHVHGLKSALASIGRHNLSGDALKLESAARENDGETIKKETPAFLRALNALIDSLSLISAANGSTGEVKDEDKEYLHEKLSEIKAACDEFDLQTADNIVKELREKYRSEHTAKMLSNLAEYILHSDIDEIEAIIDKNT